jgi:hypothetical protein
MATTPATKAPQRQLATVWFKDGTSCEYDISSPRLLYEMNQMIGLPIGDPNLGLFMLWGAAGKPGLNGHDFTIDNARPALEAWLDTMIVLPEFTEVDLAGPPTRQPKRSRGSRG